MPLAFLESSQCPGWAGYGEKEGAKHVSAVVLLGLQRRNMDRHDSTHKDRYGTRAEEPRKGNDGHQQSRVATGHSAQYTPSG